MTGFIARKIGMTRIFDKAGNSVPVTILEAGPCTVVQVKTTEKEGYNSIKLGFADVKEKFKKVVVDGKEKKVRRVPSKPLAGIFEKNNLKFKKYLKEFRTDNPANFKVGQEIKLTEIFNENDRVDVIGISKGKGFQGVMKRYNFSGGRKTHGSMFHRHGGSIGHHTFPATVYQKQKMPGHMGNMSSTSLNLKVVEINSEHNLLIVNGAVPGHSNGIVTVRKTVKVIKKRLK